MIENVVPCSYLSIPKNSANCQQ